MLRLLQKPGDGNKKLIYLIVGLLLMMSAIFGGRSSISLLIFMLLIGSILLLLWRPILGLPAIVVAALIIPLEFETGSAVSLNAASVLVPGIIGLWLIAASINQVLRPVGSRTFLPMVLFLLAGLLSLVIGNATWDPLVPRNSNFLLVQLAQWALYAFSIGTFILAANLIKDEIWLKILTWSFLALGGGLAFLYVLPNGTVLIDGLATPAISRSPFWLLLASMAGGQLLFNKGLSVGKRLLTLAVIGIVIYFVLIIEREVLSHWVAVLFALAVLVWLRWPRMGRLALIVVLILSILGFVFPVVWEFSGGEAEWLVSGGSRLALIARVVEDTMRNPLTGLGPASYRAYGAARPLIYRQTFWISPLISSHNNYVDIYSQMGILGLALFSWIVIELIILGRRLVGYYSNGFAAGYVNGAMAAGASSLVVMLFADWILPFVYNVGFRGFQASVLVWLFLGGLVALDQLSDKTVKIRDT